MVGWRFASRFCPHLPLSHLRFHSAGGRCCALCRAGRGLVVDPAGGVWGVCRRVVAPSAALAVCRGGLQAVGDRDSGDVLPGGRIPEVQILVEGDGFVDRGQGVLAVAEGGQVVGLIGQGSGEVGGKGAGWLAGREGAVYGGALPLFLGEILGRLANTGGRSQSRTAYLHVNFRKITPVGPELRFEGRFDGEEGRKRYLVGALDPVGDLTADAEVSSPRCSPGQP